MKTVANYELRNRANFLILRTKRNTRGTFLSLRVNDEIANETRMMKLADQLRSNASFLCHMETFRIPMYLYFRVGSHRLH